VVVELGKTEITAERLINLKPGDIVQLDRDAEQSLVGYIQGVPKLEGYAGVQRGYQALAIEKRMDRELS